MNTCPNCGCRVYKLGCVNCDEPAYIDEQIALTEVYGTDDPSLSGTRSVSERSAKEDIHDSGAALLPADPSAAPATTEALSKCPNTKTCNEPCEDVDGLDYCLKCGLWKGAR